MVLPSHFNYRFHKPKNCTPTKKYHPAKCTPQKKTSAPSCVSRWPLQRNGCRLAGRSISCWVCPCHLDCQSASLVGGFRSPTPLYTPLKFDDENRYTCSFQSLQNFSCFQYFCCYVKTTEKSVGRHFWDFGGFWWSFCSSIPMDHLYHVRLHQRMPTQVINIQSSDRFLSY